MNIGILASGNLGFSTINSIKKRIKPIFIGTDSKSFEIIEYAKDNGISLFIGNPREGRLFHFINNRHIDLLISINYLFLLDQDVMNIINNCVNIHGSMLPKYRGRCPHIWAIINNESKTGVTAHFIDEKCDTGDIIIQKEVSINPKDTGFKLLQKFKKLYPSIVFEIVNLANRNNLYGVKQIEVFSTFFGKRTPEDGCINWNWQKERINNWIRAQASPYPGAFTLFYNTKLIIDKISYTNIGYNFSQPNGLIIQNHPFPLIKTPNGVIQLDSIRFNNSILKPGEILHYEDRNL